MNTSPRRASVARILSPSCTKAWRSSTYGTQSHAEPSFRGTRPQILVVLLSGRAEPDEWLGLGLMWSQHGGERAGLGLIANPC